MKQLIYFVIGGEPEYANLLRFAIHTIRCHPANDIYDIMVMCDQNYSKNIDDLRSIVDIYHTPVNPSHIYASMRKVEIFNYPYIHKYDKILYLDCDILISGDLKPLFDTIIQKNLLYVVRESKDINMHNLPYYHRKDNMYDHMTLQTFAQNDIYPFNCGQFGFIATEGMQKQFSIIADEIATKYDPELHFFEQSFMNDFFNRRNGLCYDLENMVELFRLEKDTTIHLKILNHFMNASVSYNQKLKYMQQCHNWLLRRMEIALFPSRDQIHQLSLPSNPIIAEIGVFKGDFTSYMIQTLCPSKIYAIDPWTPGDIVSGDQNGNNVVSYNAEYLYDFVKNRFKHDERVHLIRKFSTDVIEIPEGSLDLLYIDGDHTFEGVSRDLILGLSWVKYGGWICGHDFDMNPEKAQHHYDFGVKKAVEEFCTLYGFRVWYLFHDGCMSFAIRK